MRKKKLIVFLLAVLLLAVLPQSVFASVFTQPGKNNGGGNNGGGNNDGGRQNTNYSQQNVETNKKYDLWIGGVQVTGKNLSGEGWRYDPSSNTLYLTGYTYEGPGRKQKYNNGVTDYSGICYDGSGTLKIVLSGESLIKMDDAKGTQSDIDIIHDWEKPDITASESGAEKTSP